MFRHTSLLLIAVMTISEFEPHSRCYACSKVPIDFAGFHTGFSVWGGKSRGHL